jgi:hypothetical protein
MKRAILFGLMLAAVALGCGSDSDSESDAGGLSQHDAEVIDEINGYVDAWNRPSSAWNNTYKSGDRAAVLRTQGRNTQRMHEASIRIRLSASQIEDPNLRRLVRELGGAYRRQLRAVVAVNNSVVNADLKAGQRAVARLQRAGDGKIRAVERLVDRYPALGRDLSG